MPAPKLNIKFSKRTKNLSRFDATFPHIIFAQLVALGYQPNEAAWVAFYGFNKLATNDKLESKAKQYLELDKTQELIRHFQDEIARSVANVPAGESPLSLDSLLSSKLNENGDMDKATLAKELLRNAETLPDGKEKVAVLMQYSALMGYKNTEDKSTTVRHTMIYIPSTCDKCPVLQWVQKNHPDALKSAKPKTDV